MNQEKIFKIRNKITKQYYKGLVFKDPTWHKTEGRNFVELEQAREMKERLEQDYKQINLEIVVFQWVEVETYD